MNNGIETIKSGPDYPIQILELIIIDQFLKRNHRYIWNVLTELLAHILTKRNTARNIATWLVTERNLAINLHLAGRVMISTWNNEMRMSQSGKGWTYHNCPLIKMSMDGYPKTSTGIWTAMQQWGIVFEERSPADIYHNITWRNNNDISRAV